MSTSDDCALIRALAKHGTAEQRRAVARFIRERTQFQPKKRGRKPQELVTHDDVRFWSQISNRPKGQTVEDAVGHRPTAKRRRKAIQKRLERYGKRQEQANDRSWALRFSKRWAIFIDDESNL